MKNCIIILGMFMMYSLTTFGQANSNGVEAGMLNTIPQENVYVHYNESLLFSGEYLLYKVFCLDSRRKELTHISKIAYVSLVDKDGKEIFTHKIRLDAGSGYGDFFVPTSIPTGSYKLLAYSQWMKNFGNDSFFQSDIHIINPYQVPPDAYLEIPKDSSETRANTVTIIPAATKKGTLDKSGLVQLSLDKSNLGKREQLTVDITSMDSSVPKGSYAISVRKIDPVAAPAHTSSAAFMSSLRRQGVNEPNTRSVSLPELRGEVVSGTVVNKETKQPVADVRVSLSLPGENYLFNVAISDANGKFRFIIDKEYNNVTGALQVLAKNWDSLEINLDRQQKNYQGIQVTDFKISEEMKDFILQKSIQNQIENGFREVKSDSLVPAYHALPFYRNFTATYDLDDYTRFNRIQETIVEVVDQVSVRRLDDGERFFEIRPEAGFTDLSLQPMVFVDGLFIKKHEDFMDYSAKKIKTISFSRDKIILGPQQFQGVLSIETIDGGFYNDFYSPHIVNIDLFKPQPNKQYFSQNYARSQSRVPDFRYQLLWEPNLDLSEGSKKLVLYTSDVIGTYELVLEGFSATGKPVSINRQFKVE